jgi:sugar-specific transcriptional regulator TrmB
MKEKNFVLNLVLAAAFILPALLLPGCKNAYYSTMEMLGHPKREILVERVEIARDSQTEVKEQFKTALEKFSEVVNFSSGELEEKYKELKKEYDRSSSKSKVVADRIAAVKNVASALFKEWEAELEQYSSQEYRAKSEQQLNQTRQRYDKLIAAMERAHEKIAPVLVVFKDQVLFLKHNLNAQAIASLQGELASMEADVGSLIREMEASIAEADAFIEQMLQQ